MVLLTVEKASKRKGMVIGKIMNAGWWESFSRKVAKTATPKRKILSHAHACMTVPTELTIVVQCLV